MKFEIARDSVSLCGIWCDKGMEKAAEQLSLYLEKITGGEYSVITERTGQRFEILFDESVKYFSYEIDSEKFMIVAPDVIYAGWGVFHLLENVAGCVFCTSSYEVIPKKPSLTLETDKYVHDQPFENNYVYYRDFMDNPLFAMKNGMCLMGYSKDDCKTYYSEESKWTAHTLGSMMLNYEKYKDHPEYFCMKNGERVKPEYSDESLGLGGEIYIQNLQPCLSNPDVFEIVCDELQRYMDERPDVKVWNISQSDSLNYCECPECAKIDEEEGSHVGTYLRFVNKVAARFPDKFINTLAYQFSKTPCKLTKPADNVGIVLCNFEAFRDKPIVEDPDNEVIKNDLVGWRKLTNNIFYWDYCIEFPHLISPFPNFRSIAANMRFFAEGGIRTLFSQCNREVLGEFAELRAYYIAKLAANPYDDPNAIIEKFCNAYYGKAAPYIIEYINIMHDALENSEAKLWIGDNPIKASEHYLSYDLYEKYVELFDKAEMQVSDNSEIFNHVRLARMPLYYAGLVIGYGDKKSRLDILAKFTKTAQDNNIDMVHELGKDTLRKFVVDTAAQLAE